MDTVIGLQLEQLMTHS